MSVFTPQEIEYLETQRLGRLATVGAAGNPHVVPVGFRYNPKTETIDIGGYNPRETRKWHHAAAHPRVAFVVDDVLPPWRPRSIEIRADVELLNGGGRELGPGFAQHLMRLHPVRVISWGIADQDRSSRSVAKG